MYGFIFYLVVIAVMRWFRRKRVPKARGLCAGCSFAHVQYGTNAKVATFCTFGGVVRPVALEVLYCTDYRDRNAKPRTVSIGFVPHNGNAEWGVAETVGKTS